MTSVKKIRSKSVACDPALVQTRLHRIQGQVVGIERMLLDKRDCPSILQQIVAAREALDKVAATVLEQEVNGCFKNSKQKNAQGDLKRAIELIFKTL
ncbi:metal-sensitive transcriptional regulator [Patescibacteria group bacterium]|nr:metal-sensitive transcriptional regulator [Patescibacteria group bacterium]